MGKKTKLGIGAQCSIANKYLHPGKLITDKYPNQTAQSKFGELCLLQEGEEGDPEERG